MHTHCLNAGVSAYELTIWLSQLSSVLCNVDFTSHPRYQPLPSPTSILSPWVLAFSICRRGNREKIKTKSKKKPLCWKCKCPLKCHRAVPSRAAKTDLTRSNFVSTVLWDFFFKKKTIGNVYNYCYASVCFSLETGSGNVTIKIDLLELCWVCFLSLLSHYFLLSFSARK